jgi:hypothetical protein
MKGYWWWRKHCAARRRRPPRPNDSEDRGDDGRSNGAGNAGCFKFAHIVPDGELQDLPRRQIQAARFAASWIDAINGLRSKPMTTLNVIEGTQLASRRAEFVQYVGTL